MHDRIRVLSKDKFLMQTLAALAKLHHTSIDYLLNLTMQLKLIPKK